jgi:signal transduction histidine kinase
VVRLAKEGKKEYRSLYFIENYLISIILLIVTAYALINHVFGHLNLSIFNLSTEAFIRDTVGNALFNLKSSLLSIAAIFIGIYVTVFTLLGSIKVDSIFAFLNEYTFKKLVKFIRNAFIAAFSYLVLIISLDVAYESHIDIPFVYVVINSAIVIYMFLTALRFGVILYIAFSKDLNNIQENIHKHRQERKRIESLQFRIEAFLEDFENNKREEQADKMSKIIKGESEE